MKILVLTTLFPNAALPHHGVFVENRLRAYLEKYSADVRVVAPAPWFPSRHERFGRYSAWARTPRSETRNGLPIDHPRYLLPPKIGMNYVPHSLEKCFLRAIEDVCSDGWDFDLIDAHYLYPDGVAAAAVAKRLGKPIILTGRGTDINLIPEYEKPRARILGAVSQAHAVITVAEALREKLINLGAAAEKITTLRNGVDLSVFHPIDQTEARAQLGLPSGDVIACVGHLTERKGHHHVIDALAQLSGATLIIAGDGEERRSLEARAAAKGVGERVRFLGSVPHDKLADVYSAATVFALASSREGWPNVLLEAMACGAPVVASNVWGAGEIVKTQEAGRLVPYGDVAALAGALAATLENPPDRRATRAYAEGFSWEETADGMHEIFRSAIAQKRAA
ncbi:MAG: glycosyltransferase family 4 protein [Pseudomonadota bacterium]